MNWKKLLISVFIGIVLFVILFMLDLYFGGAFGIEGFIYEHSLAGCNSKMSPNLIACYLNLLVILAISIILAIISYKKLKI